VRPVGQADAHADGLRLAVHPHHPHAPSRHRPASAGPAPRRHFLVALALLRVEDLRDAGARFRAHPLGLLAPLALVSLRDPADPVARLVEYHFHLGLLLGGQVELLGEPLALRLALLCAAPALLLAFPGGRDTGLRGRGALARLGCGAGGAEPQCRVRHLENILARVGHDTHVGGHAREELEVGIGSADDGGVGNDVLDHRRGPPHLLDPAPEHPAGKRIDRERRRLALAYASDLGFVNRGIDLHPAQILRNHEKLGRLQARRHRLSRLDRFLDHDAVHRRADGGAVEVHLGLSELRLALPDQRLDVADLRLARRELCLGGLQLLARGFGPRLRLVERRRRDEILLEQALVALELALGLSRADLRAGNLRLQRGDVGALGQHGGARRLEVRHRLVHAQVERVGVDARDDLAFLDLGVEIDMELLDLPRYLRAHLHRGHRVHRAGGGDGSGDGAALHPGQAILRGGVARAPPRVQGDRHGHDGNGGDSNEHFRARHIGGRIGKQSAGSGYDAGNPRPAAACWLVRARIVADAPQRPNRGGIAEVAGDFSEGRAAGARRGRARLGGRRSRTRSAG
jgi:hypothetical protein